MIDKATLEKTKSLFDKCSPLFLALGDSQRQKILMDIAEAGEINVSDLASMSSLSRPAVSHHLKLLKDYGVVAAIKKGTKKAGKNIKLNGIQAATYCRIRKATFYDPNTGEAISNDFGRAARQRSVVMKLVEKAKKASVTELQDMVETVMNSDSKKKRIISTSFSFDEIVNLIPVIFDFELEGTTGFPSQLTTGTIDGASLVIPKGLSANVTELHKFLYDEENYVPTATVQAIDNYVKGYTGVNEMSEGYDPIKSGIVDKEAITKKNDFDYDDHWISPYYK